MQPRAGFSFRSDNLPHKTSIRFRPPARRPTLPPQTDFFFLNTMVLCNSPFATSNSMVVVVEVISMRNQLGVEKIVLQALLDRCIRYHMNENSQFRHSSVHS